MFALVSLDEGMLITRNVVSTSISDAFGPSVTTCMVNQN